MTLDIENPVVAEKYIAFLNEEFSNIKRNVRENPEELVEVTAGGSGGFKLPMSMFSDVAEKSGIKDVKKVSPTDADFERL